MGGWPARDETVGPRDVELPEAWKPGRTQAGPPDLIQDGRMMSITKQQVVKYLEATRREVEHYCAVHAARSKDTRLEHNLKKYWDWVYGIEAERFEAVIASVVDHGRDTVDDEGGER